MLNTLYAIAGLLFFILCYLAAISSDIRKMAYDKENDHSELMSYIKDLKTHDLAADIGEITAHLRDWRNPSADYY